MEYNTLGKQESKDKVINPAPFNIQQIQLSQPPGNFFVSPNGAFIACHHYNLSSNITDNAPKEFINIYSVIKQGCIVQIPQCNTQTLGWLTDERIVTCDDKLLTIDNITGQSSKELTLPPKITQLILSPSKQYIALFHHPTEQHVRLTIISLKNNTKKLAYTSAQCMFDVTSAWGIFTADESEFVIFTQEQAPRYIIINLNTGAIIDEYVPVTLVPDTAMTAAWNDPHLIVGYDLWHNLCTFNLTEKKKTVLMDNEGNPLYAQTLLKLSDDLFIFSSQDKDTTQVFAYNPHTKQRGNSHIFTNNEIISITPNYEHCSLLIALRSKVKYSDQDKILEWMPKNNDLREISIPSLTEKKLCHIERWRNTYYLIFEATHEQSKDFLYKLVTLTVSQ